MPPAVKEPDVDSSLFNLEFRCGDGDWETVADRSLAEPDLLTDNRFDGALNEERAACDLEDFPVIKSFDEARFNNVDEGFLASLRASCGPGLSGAPPPPHTYACIRTRTILRTHTVALIPVLA